MAKNNLIKRIRINLRKSTYRKRVSMFLLCIVLVIGVLLTSAYFIFKANEDDINKHKTIAYMYDGEKHDAPPAKERYEIDVVNCDKAVGTWDNTKWNLTLTDIEGKTTCILNYKKRLSVYNLKIDPD